MSTHNDLSKYVAIIESLNPIERKVFAHVLEYVFLYKREDKLAKQYKAIKSLTDKGIIQLAGDHDYPCYELTSTYYRIAPQLREIL